MTYLRLNCTSGSEVQAQAGTPTDGTRTPRMSDGGEAFRISTTSDITRGMSTRIDIDRALGERAADTPAIEEKTIDTDHRRIASRMRGGWTTILVGWAEVEAETMHP